ncbi:hypothetical protein D3C76_1266440 [compost metagenome]
MPSESLVNSPLELMRRLLPSAFQVESSFNRALRSTTGVTKIAGTGSGSSRLPSGRSRLRSKKLPCGAGMNGVAMSRVITSSAWSLAPARSLMV